MVGHISNSAALCPSVGHQGNVLSLPRPPRNLIPAVMFDSCSLLPAFGKRGDNYLSLHEPNRWLHSFSNGFESRSLGCQTRNDQDVWTDFFRVSSSWHWFYSSDIFALLEPFLHQCFCKCDVSFLNGTDSPAPQTFANWHLPHLTPSAARQFPIWPYTSSILEALPLRANPLH